MRALIRSPCSLGLQWINRTTLDWQANWADIFYNSSQQETRISSRLDRTARCCRGVWVGGRGRTIDLRAVVVPRRVVVYGQLLVRPMWSEVVISHISRAVGSVRPLQGLIRHLLNSKQEPDYIGNITSGSDQCGSFGLSSGLALRCLPISSSNNEEA